MLPLTAEERILIAVVSTVVVAVTQVSRVDADVVAVTLDLAFRTQPVSCRGEGRAKVKGQNISHRIKNTGHIVLKRWR